MMVIGIKTRIIEDTDGSSSQANNQEDMEVGEVDEDEIRAKMAMRDAPSSDAMAKFQDYRTCCHRSICHTQAHKQIRYSDSIHQ